MLASPKRLEDCSWCLVGYCSYFQGSVACSLRVEVSLVAYWTHVRLRNGTEAVSKKAELQVVLRGTSGETIEGSSWRTSLSRGMEGVKGARKVWRYS